jgi:pyruvate/2-oxoglutarate dehydrogenase complex dihydrolipoamide acyltransferase (E2) component
MRQFLLPDLGEGLEEAQLVQWLVCEGDMVSLNQPLCQVETAKAMVDVPSPYAGLVAQLHARPGDVVPVGAPLVTITETATAQAESGAGEGKGPVLVGYGTEGPAQSMQRRRRAPVGGAAQVGQQAPIGADGGGQAEVAATPLVRKIAAEHGIDLRAVRGSGPGGRIRAEDLEPLLAGAARSENGAAAATSRVTVAVADEPGDERISTVGLRKAIAARMVRSATTIPQFTEYGLFDASELVALKARLREDSRFVGARLTYLPFFVLALVAAVREYPIMNARWDEEGNAIVVRKAIHVGIATDTERGLLVPVIHRAHERTLAETAAEAERLVELARGGKLDAASLSGSTITITNVGAAGPVETGAPLINPPEACVVGFGAIKPRPTVVGNEVQVHPGAWISISCDHRIVDGATAASFLGALVRQLEAPEGLTGAE